MRILIVILAALWGLAAVGAFLLAQEKPADAKLTAAYILGYPALVVGLFLNEPVPMWIAVPAMFGLIPWIRAPPLGPGPGPHGRPPRRAHGDPNGLLGLGWDRLPAPWRGFRRLRPPAESPCDRPTPNHG